MICPEWACRGAVCHNDAKQTIVAIEGFLKLINILYQQGVGAKLQQMMQAKGLGDRVIVRHFHGWCSDQLKTHRLPKPDYRQYQGEAYVEQLVHQVAQSVAGGHIPGGKYGAVMIDEGHDFRSEWLKLIVQMFDPHTNALLVLYDDAQDLYRKSKKQAFSFKSIGIQAQGRPTIVNGTDDSS